MGKGGKPKTTTSETKTTNAPPGYLGNAYERVIAEALAQYNKGQPAYYGGDTVADMTPTQQLALQRITERSTKGSPSVQAANEYVQRTLAGEYMDNPYLKDYLSVLGGQANNMVNTQFNAGGRLGSGANIDTASRAITEAQLPSLFQNYQNERSLQQQAAGLSIPLANQDYVDLQALYGAGQTQQGQNQAEIDADMQKYFYDAYGPQQNLSNLANLVYSHPTNYGTTTGVQTQTTSGGGGSRLGNILGTGLTLASMFAGGGPLAGLGLGFPGAGAGFGLNSLGQSVGGLFSGSSYGPYAAFSDRRLKENIEFVGEEKGHKIYKFNYIGTPEKMFIGVMADEVKKINPDAVTNQKGFDIVNYDLIGLELKSYDVTAEA
jgi:hypothetical protein